MLTGGRHRAFIRFSCRMEESECIKLQWNGSLLGCLDRLWCGFSARQIFSETPASVAASQRASWFSAFLRITYSPTVRRRPLGWDKCPPHVESVSAGLHPTGTRCAEAPTAVGTAVHRCPLNQIVRILRTRLWAPPGGRAPRPFWCHGACCARRPIDSVSLAPLSLRAAAVFFPASCRKCHACDTSVGCDVEESFWVSAWKWRQVMVHTGRKLQYRYHRRNSTEHGRCQNWHGRKAFVASQKMTDKWLYDISLFWSYLMISHRGQTRKVTGKPLSNPLMILNLSVALMIIDCWVNWASKRNNRLKKWQFFSTSYAFANIVEFSILKIRDWSFAETWKNYNRSRFRAAFYRQQSKTFCVRRFFLVKFIIKWKADFVLTKTVIIF